MLYDSLTTAPDANQTAIVTTSSSTTWGELNDLISLRRDQFSSIAPHSVAIALPPTADGIAALAAFDSLQSSVYLLDDQLSQFQQTEIANRFAIPFLLTAPASAAEPWHVDAFGEPVDNSSLGAPHAVTIMTSGTEGQPKAVAHTWKSLARPVRRAPSLNEHRWLLSYRAQLYAGLQVMLQALLNHGTLIAPLPGSSPDDVVQLMAEGQTTHASATPSYWRRLLLFSDHKKLSQIGLRQITLGGEATDQQLLDSLRQCFPSARIAHIYATTELGRCFSVTDGQAGFPASFLDGPTADGVELRIDDEQLHVRSANAMRGYQSPVANETNEVRLTKEDWFATGDVVKQVGDRIHFAGRATEMINVGGNKVRPLQVESIIRAVPGVVDARVYAKSSSIAGELVACQFVPSSEQDAESVKQAIATACTEELAPYQRPRFIDAVSEISLTVAGKVKR